MSKHCIGEDTERAAALPAAPRASAGHAPPRRPSSVRRTASIDATWPEDRINAMAFDARARDLLTHADGRGEVLAFDQVAARIIDRAIEAITCAPARPGLQKLLGARGGNQMRSILNEALPEERIAGTPLYLLIDDFAGASLIGPGVWQHWPAADPEVNPVPFSDIRANAIAKMEGVCISFQRGSTAMLDVRGDLQNFADVVPLPDPADPLSWHPMPANQGKSLRRARRIDVWREDGAIRVDAMFQDTAGTPSGVRRAIHEYGIDVLVDGATMTIKRIGATARVLPYPECPSAVAKLQLLVGTPMRELRSAVLEHLPKTMGCTHLNDALRALAEVPTMAAALDRSHA